MVNFITSLLAGLNIGLGLIQVVIAFATYFAFHSYIWLGFLNFFAAIAIGFSDNFARRAYLIFAVPLSLFAVWNMTWMSNEPIPNYFFNFSPSRLQINMMFVMVPLAVNFVYLSKKR